MLPYTQHFVQPFSKGCSFMFCYLSSKFKTDQNNACSKSFVLCCRRTHCMSWSLATKATSWFPSRAFLIRSSNRRMPFLHLHSFDMAKREQTVNQMKMHWSACIHQLLRTLCFGKQFEFSTETADSAETIKQCRININYELLMHFMTSVCMIIAELA